MGTGLNDLQTTGSGSLGTITRSAVPQPGHRPPPHQPGHRRSQGLQTACSDRPRRAALPIDGITPASVTDQRIRRRRTAGNYFWRSVSLCRGYWTLRDDPPPQLRPRSFPESAVLSVVGLMSMQELRCNRWRLRTMAEEEPSTEAPPGRRRVHLKRPSLRRSSAAVNRAGVNLYSIVFACSRQAV